MERGYSRKCLMPPLPAKPEKATAMLEILPCTGQRARSGTGAAVPFFTDAGRAWGRLLLHRLYFTITVRLNRGAIFASSSSVITNFPSRTDIPGLTARYLAR